MSDITNFKNLLNLLKTLIYVQKDIDHNRNEFYTYQYDSKTYLLSKDQRAIISGYHVSKKEFQEMDLTTRKKLEMTLCIHYFMTNSVFVSHDLTGPSYIFLNKNGFLLARHFINGKAYKKDDFYEQKEVKEELRRKSLISKIDSL